MGNSFGCSASGERLVSAARDGDLIEAKMLLDCNPWLAKYSTFGGLNSPLHFASAKGHNEIVSLLLENGADVNSRNYCGQTSLMQACRYGQWEVVQTLVLFKCNVRRADYLSGRTALYFASVNGHARCIRLLVSDFVPSLPFDSINPNSTSISNRNSALAKFVNKAADGGITALHMAALNCYFDCVQLLLDLQANTSAATFHYGASMDLIGAGSTPLHYAACGGNLKCVQILLARGASRLSLNCNGWLPLDVAKMWRRHWLEPILNPNSTSVIPSFPRSNYLALPLFSVLNIAREYGLQPSSSITSGVDDADTCAVCLERSCAVAAEGCGHKLCVRCALYLCSTANINNVPLEQQGSIPCPHCRHAIVSFVKLTGIPAKEESKVSLPLGLCTPAACLLHSSEVESNSTPEIRKNRVSPDLFCPVSRSPFPSAAAMCTCTVLQQMEEEEDTREDSGQVKSGMGAEKVISCSNMLRGRTRSYRREHQCNSEIST
ncbi:E3 ubiquitin-protein ligase XBAT33-like [Impatiens glandulifera]|uniref:E3 ubiquitin-protein ligase XBAT33-like n=1 Tax=Impatiens glandulifera TaxID=253017 RepID=UPI001FB0AF31|nr:E3 ubiquitin-protein ligase XBAT33-like [Impatiens glandulifera]